MKKGFFRLLFFLSFPLTLFGAELSMIEFQQKGEVSQLILTLDRADVKASKSAIPEDKQIILELSEKSLSKSVFNQCLNLGLLNISISPLISILLPK